MEEFQPLTEKSKASIRKASLIFGLAGTFLSLLAFGSFAFDGMDFPWIVFVIGLFGIGLSAYMLMQNKELTPHGAKVQKAKFDSLIGKWYTRWALSIFACFMAATCYKAWETGVQFSSILVIAVNPIAGGVWAISAAILAWEVALALLVIGFVYMLFVGASLLPVSIAVILGACIIAYAIYRKN